MRKWLHIAANHVSENDRYRHAALYSILLAGLFQTINHWPADSLYFWATLEHPWISGFQTWVVRVTLLLSIALGLIAVLQRPWAAKVLGAIGVAYAARSLWSYEYYITGQTPIADATRWVLYWAFDLPMEFIHRISFDSSTVATPLYALYLALIWLLLRPLYFRLGAPIKRLEGRIVDRWPHLERLARPLL